MIISSTSLDALRTGFSAAFRGGLDQAQTQYGRITTTVPSTTREQKFGWIGKLPSMREWIGPRVVQNLAEHDYSIVNKPFELTLGVDRHDIEDDNLGQYQSLFTEMGAAAASHPDQLVWQALKAGWTNLCYDGQFFFDTDHPVIAADGSTVSVANTDGGAGLPWFLMSTRRTLRPMLLQMRQEPRFVRKDAETDEGVFNNREFKYGVDARMNVGYGFWQMAYGSKQTLDKANFASAFAAIEGMVGDHGRPLGLVPDLLVVPPGLRVEALEILNAERDAAGATNVWRGQAELLVVPWLA